MFPYAALACRPVLVQAHGISIAALMFLDGAKHWLVLHMDTTSVRWKMNRPLAWL